MSQPMCPFPQSCPTLVELLRQRAAQAPSRPAFFFLLDAGTARDALTYGELDRRARAVATRLQSLGLTGQRALLLYPPGLDYVVAFFGCLYAGVIAVPAYPPRRHRSLDRLHAIVSDAQAAAVLTTPVVAASCRHDLQALSQPHPLHWLLSDELSVEPEQTWRDPGLSEDSLAFLQYTSGSTTTPRGVMLTHENLLHNCGWINRKFGPTPDSRSVIWLPPYHDMGLIGGILQPIYTGFPCYLMSPVSFFSNPFSWLQAVSCHQATFSGGPDFAYDLCLRKVTAEQRATLDLSCWQVAFSGAEPVRMETLNRFAEVFAPCGFRREAFYPCYGLAEATLLVTGGTRDNPPRALHLRKEALESNRAEPAPGGVTSQVLVGCGESLTDQQILVVHPEKLTRCQPGDVGEIWVAGRSVATGYWGQPDETRRTFAAHLADTGEGPFLRTGDLGLLHEGELFVTGRLKDLLILRGRNLYPHDLEWTAQRSYPDLNPGCGAAFSVESDGQERLVIAYEVIPRRQADVGTVAEAVRRAVADEHEAELYAFVLLKLGAMPKTSSGKIQRQACRSAFLAGTLEAHGEWRASRPHSHFGLTRAAVLCVPLHQRQALLETHFRGLVARVLRLDPAAIDPHQPVNTLGLDSLATLELKNALWESLGVTLPVTRFLMGASISTLASQVLTEFAQHAPAPAPQNMNSLLQQVQQLSGDQVKALFDADRAAP